MFSNGYIQKVKGFIPSPPTIYRKKHVGNTFVRIEDNSDPYEGEDYRSFTLSSLIESEVPLQNCPKPSANNAMVSADMVRSVMSNELPKND